MKKIISVLLVICMFFCFVGCDGGTDKPQPLPDNPPENPSSNREIKDDLYSGVEEELIKISRERIIKFRRATSYFAEHENCIHQSDITSVSETEMYGYEWMVYLSDGIYYVDLLDVVGLGATEVWHGEYFPNDDGYELIREYAQYVYTDDFNNLLVICNADAKSKGISNLFFEGYQEFAYTVYLEFEGFESFGYEWRFEKNGDVYNVYLDEIYGLGVDTKYEAIAFKNSEGKWSLQPVTNGPVG